MSYATWQEKFLIGVPELDDDHRMLFDLVDQVHEAYARGRIEDDLERVFGILMDYVESHFRREEDFMRDRGYAGLDEHQGHHGRLKAELEDLHRRFLAREPGLALELLAFLKNWLHFHIMEEDMRYKEALGLGAGS
jgi:hemerythrin